MKRSADLSRLRLLCALGLPAEALIPAVLDALHRVIPSACNLFDWTAPDGRLDHYYFEGPIDHEINKHYFERFHNRLESEVMLSFAQAVTGTAVIHSASQLDRPEFFRSALYNEIWRPQKLHTRLEAIIRGRRGRPLGSLVLYRGPGDPKFTPAEEKVLAQVVPYLTGGIELSGRLPSDGKYAQTPREVGYVSLDAQGRLEHLSPNALKLLLLSHGGITPEAASRSVRREDFKVLTKLWYDLVGRSSAHTADLEVPTPWGRFVFEGCRWGQGGLHIAVRQHELIQLRFRRAVESLDLTPMQSEVCQLLRAGHSHTQIARQMSIATSTVADHVKKIYTRLDVRSVQELTRLIDMRAST